MYSKQYDTELPNNLFYFSVLISLFSFSILILIIIETCFRYIDLDFELDISQLNHNIMYYDTNIKLKSNSEFRSECFIEKKS